LRLGAGGARFNVIESMALSTALVGTAIGIEGLELADGEEYLHAEKPLEFAEACLRLLKDEDLRHRVAAAGRRRMELSYDWRVLSRSIEDRLQFGANLPRAMAS
jgi:glycosyltransferase involved in cell wall biosynthesis